MMSTSEELLFIGLAPKKVRFGWEGISTAVVFYVINSSVLGEISVNRSDILKKEKRRLITTS